MANNETNSSQKVNPVLLVVLGIVIVGASIYWFTTQPKTQAPASPALNQVESNNQTPENNTIATNESGVGVPNTINTKAETKIGGKAERKVDDAIPVGSLRRNPFLTPSIYVSASSGSSSNTPSNTPNSIPTSISPSDKNKAPVVQEKPKSTPLPVVTKTEESPKEPELRLGAVFSKNGDKLALIYYNNKGYILRQRDIIRGSGYILRNIEPNSVTLTDNNGKETKLLLAKTKPKGGA